MGRPSLLEGRLNGTMNLGKLPETLLTRIERARVKAERQFRKDEKRLPGYSKPHIPGKPCSWFVHSAQARRLLIDRIKNEVLEVAHEVNVCARLGLLRHVLLHFPVARTRRCAM